MPGNLMPCSALRGHDRIAHFLQDAFSGERLAHALLFGGPEGVGKRSLAMAFAAWIFCSGREGTDACGSCESCRQLVAGSHPDFLLVGLPAGKKEIGVERARELKRFVQLRPLRSPFKVAIVDDAHLLNVSAQNALLKTLEEPPNRCLIVLVASRPDALLSTVRSRCQRVRFAPIADDIVREILTARGVDTEAAGAAASQAEGSVARALALSDTAVVEERASIARLLAGVGGGRYSALMRLAEVLGKPESELPAKMEALLDIYRDEALQHLGEKAVRDHALRCSALVREACDALRTRNPNRQLLVESLLVRLASA